MGRVHRAASTPIETVEIRARVSGHLNEVHFKDGQFVNQGDLLFVIDPRPFERALEQARAELLQADHHGWRTPTST